VAKLSDSLAEASPGSNLHWLINLSPKRPLTGSTKSTNTSAQCLQRCRTGRRIGSCEDSLPYSMSRTPIFSIAVSQCRSVAASPCRVTV
jgi:hypothetical protein